MKTIETTLFLKDDHPFFNLCTSKQESVLAFDIETTGFSPAASCLYLIGMVIKKQESFRLIQLFGESFSDEPLLLSQFFSICKEFETLLSFNGDGFDIPYLRNCCRQYGMHFPLDNMKSIDIYKEIRPFKKLFPGGGLNQKTLESLLLLPRKDMFSGGELIEVYEKYQKTQDLELLSLLLLHNFEDLTGLLSLTSLLAYKAVFEGGFRLLSQWR